MGRRYKQEGYQVNGGDREKAKSQQQPKRTREGPRSPRMPGFQEVMRCAMCGNIISSLVEIRVDSQCPKCEADLRTCKHCRHFDTAAQFECTQPIPKRIVKDVRNDCEFFDLRTAVERETTSPSSQGSGRVPATPGALSTISSASNPFRPGTLVPVPSIL